MRLTVITNRFKDALCQECVQGIPEGEPVYWLGRGRGVLCQECGRKQLRASITD